MANRFPLVVDSSALQIKEIPANDNLDLANNSIVNVVNITASGNVSVAGTLTYEDVKNVDSVGLVTARTGVEIGTPGIAATLTAAGGAVFVGVVTASSFDGPATQVTVADESSDTSCNILFTTGATGNLPPKTGTNLTFNSSTGNLTATKFTGDGSSLTGVISGVEVKSDGTSAGTGLTALNFSGATIVGDSTAGIATITIASAGLTTAAATPSNAVVTLDLSSAQDHKVTATGIVTVTCSGGTEGDSHTVRIINSGISTVGFSTYFLFPSGNSPSLPTGNGDISLISFTVNRVGTAGTQLLAGSSLNFS